MQVDIYIREKSGTREIRVPILPEKIAFSGGEATFIAYTIMGIGEVAVPSGTELAPYSWQSEFPGELRQNDPMQRGPWQHPKTYDSILQDWKKNGTELNLMVTGYPINTDVYLKTYNPTASGPFGDIYYEIAFVESREITITTTIEQQEDTTRPAATSTTYTIKSGDTLWKISKMFYGTGNKWETIYNANKDIIENTAKKYGKKSSSNGHWIYPGVTLTIPDASATPSQSTTPTTNPSTQPSNTPTSTEEKKEAYLTQRNQGIQGMVNGINRVNMTK